MASHGQAARIPSAAPQPSVALYVHIPFCVSLCPYCDFVVYAGAAARGPRNRVAAFMAALLWEVRLRADALDERFGPVGGDERTALASIYLGGGTPTLLPSDAVAELLGLVSRRFGVASDAEITIEANPGPDERGDAVALRQAGVTRISLGAQSFDRDELRRLGRRHRPEDVADAVLAARDAGIGSISLDLLYDVPAGSGSTSGRPETWQGSLEAALALAPDHLSLYALTLDDPEAEGLTGLAGDHLPTTAGARRWRERARLAQDDDRAATEYTLATERLGAAGWRGYEISNWARPGHESRHNLAYWERRPYEAIGPGAHAFDGVTRRWNAARLDGYLAALAPADGAPPALPPGRSEKLDPQTAIAEAIILGLRTDRGVPIAASGRPPLASVYDWALAAGLVEVADAGDRQPETEPPDASDGQRIVLTTRGRLLSNELFSRLV